MSWAPSSIGGYLRIKHGYAFQSKCFCSNGVYAVLTPGHFYEGGGFRCRSGEEKFYVGDFPDEYVLNKGDLVIVMTEQAPGLIGAAAIVPEGGKYLHNQRIGLITDLNEVELDKGFLFHLFNSHEVRKQLHISASGTKVRHSAPERVYAVQFEKPPIGVQRDIAKMLFDWDRAIFLAERLATVKQEQRKGLMQQLLSGKRRFSGYTKPWKEVKLGEIFSNRTESGCADLPLVSITGNEGVVFRDNLERKDTSSADKSNYLRICPGDIGYNTMRMWQGVSGLSQIEGIVSPAYTIVTPDDSLDPEFMALLFKYPPMVHLFYRYSQGLVSDTWNLKFKHFAEIHVRLPEKSEQEAISKLFRPVDRENTLLRRQLDALKEQKKGLMQQLLTGKKRIKVPGAAA